MTLLRFSALSLLVSSTLLAQAPPVATKTFTPDVISVGGISRLQMTVTNPNAAAALTAIAFTDTFPAGLLTASPIGITAVCSPAAALSISPASSGEDHLNIGLNLPANGSCTFSLQVTSTTPGTVVNTVTPVDNVAGAGGTVSATLTVLDALPINATKSFGVVAIPIGGTTTLSFAIQNPNLFPLTGITFNDVLPAGLRVADPNGIAGTCAAVSTITAVPGTNAISLAGLTLTAGASCSFAVRVLGIAEGIQTNTTGQIASAEGVTGPGATASIFVGSAFQTNFAANLGAGETYINLTNTGFNGASLLGPGFGGPLGNICVNVYAFSPDEQMISCCSCLLTPNALANLGVNRDLTSKTLTGVIPTTVAVKLVTTLAGARGSGTSCANSAAVIGETIVTGGLGAWRATLHPGPAGLVPTETPFSPATLSFGELESLRGRCAAILGNGSGYGICRSCQAGALGADRM